MKKGFIFVETMVVIAFLGTVLLTVYSSFTTVLDTAKTRLYYDDSVYLYRTYYILSFLEENNLTDYIKDKFGAGSTSTTNIISEFGCTGSKQITTGENSNSEIEFCSDMTHKFEVNHIYIMPYIVNKVVACKNQEEINSNSSISVMCRRNSILQTLSVQAVNYLYSLDGYTGTSEDTEDDVRAYRIVVEFKKSHTEEVEYYEYINPTDENLDACDTTKRDYDASRCNRCKANPGLSECKNKKPIEVFKYYYATLEIPFGDNGQRENSVVPVDSFSNRMLDNVSSNSCMKKYTGEVTDEPGRTVNATKVYYASCPDKRNIIFGGFCWHLIRTTETGGVKIMYNGKPEGGKCLSTRGDHKGIIGENGTSQNLSGSYLYGDSFSYNESSGVFTLTNARTGSWSDSTYESLLGMYTCKNTTGTCTTIYNVNGYLDNNTAYTAAYTIGDSQYSIIGKSPFNAHYKSLAMVGYMFNKAYHLKVLVATGKYGSTFTYNNSTNMYTLSGTIQDGDQIWNRDIKYTHYTCFNETGTCNRLAYVYIVSSQYLYYIELSGGKSIEDAKNEMMYNTDVNNHSSSIKGIVDAWYENNMIDKTSLLEDAVYCNDRSIYDVHGWNPNGGGTYYRDELKFVSYRLKSTLKCPNITDQFSSGNSVALLKYPVAIVGREDNYIMDPYTLMGSNIDYWILSPYGYDRDRAAMLDYTDDRGAGWGYTSVYRTYGVRPVVSLNKYARVTSGSGSETDPWIVE